MKPLTTHKIRDDAGRLVGLLDLVEPELPIAGNGMLEISADIAGRSIRLRLYPRQAERCRAA